MPTVDGELERLRAAVQPVMEAVTGAIVHASGWKMTEAQHNAHEAKIERAAMGVVAQALQEPHEILLLFNEISRDITSDWAQKYETLRSTRLQTYIDRVGLREAADSYEGRQRWLATAEALVERLKVNP